MLGSKHVYRECCGMSDFIEVIMSERRVVHLLLVYGAIWDSAIMCALSGGSRCPNASALQEMRSCNEHACIVYHWQTGPWGPCTEDTSVTMLNSTRATPTGQGKTSCATGMQTRKVICVKVNVGQVPPKK